MPAKLSWAILTDRVSTKDADRILMDFKAFKTDKSELKPCRVCTSQLPHNMRRRIFLCKSKCCAAAMPFGTCSWKGKTLTCLLLSEVTVLECNTHVTALRSPRSAPLTSTMKEAAGEMTAQGLKPVRIRNELLRQFKLDETSTPALKTVQHFAQYFARKQLGGTDNYEEIRAQVENMAFSPGQQECEPFTFTCKTSVDGAPLLGVGTDEEPFIVGLTSVRLLSRMDRDPGSFVLHGDATFKLNQAGYPVFVVGMSDSARSFHLVALFVTSQRRESDLLQIYDSLGNVYRKLVGKPLRVRYAMSDADDAQLNATLSALGSGCSSRAGSEAELGFESPNLLPLMCYYHVVAKVYQRTRSLRPALAAKVLRNVGEMHYTLSKEEFSATKASVLADWEGIKELGAFRSYFETQWLNGSFTNWQIFRTPQGFATTNNPVEQFNRTLKRVYTLHARLKMGNLLMQMSTCCRVEGMSMKPFNLGVVPTASLQRRMRELRRERKLYVPLPPRNTIAFLLDDQLETGAGDLVRVLSTRCERILDPATGRKSELLLTTAQMSTCDARMETLGMPEAGWTVNVPERTCECRYFAKFRSCVHLLLLLSSRGISASGKREVLYYRGPNKARRLANNGQQAGRPARNSSALVIE